MASLSAQVKEQQTSNDAEKAYGAMQFALSRLQTRTQNFNNNGIHTRFRPLAKLSTVSLVGRRQHTKPNRNLPHKQKGDDDFTVGLEECIQSRPPLKIDLSGPKPTTYDPPTYLPWETSSPSYTMRPKTQPEKVSEEGGDRVAWNKQWIASHDIWTYRAHFDERYPWPSPATYTSKTTIGSQLPYLPQSPSHSMAKRKALILNKFGSEKEPAPNEYNYGSSKLKLMRTFPAYSVQEGRRGGTMVWTAREPVPGPGSYNPRSYRTSGKRCAPNYSLSRTPRDVGITRNCTF